MPTRFILVRHGETLANREFRYVGARDDPLSEHGQVQATLLAYHTALPIAEQHHVTVQTLDALRENNFGTWEGLSRAEVLERSTEDKQLLQAWEYDATIAPPAGESFAALQVRVCATVERLAQNHPNQTVVLVSHVGPIKVLLCTALGAPLSSLLHMFLDPATISIVDWRQPCPVVRLFNSHAHLGWERARWM
ncbi:MAG: histidine phosphatase family protein [Chloroflexi bacterium]|nr:MAG: histidine phosphatase family protein [Chloroflexota bacterium]